MCMMDMHQIQTPLQCPDESRSMFTLSHVVNMKHNVFKKDVMHQIQTPLQCPDESRSMFTLSHVVNMKHNVFMKDVIDVMTSCFFVIMSQFYPNDIF